MRLLRKPPYPLSVTYSVPDSDAEYILVIKDRDRNDTIVQENVVSNEFAEISYTLPDSFSRYDDSYDLEIYSDADGEMAEIVVQDNLEITRPYVDPETLGATASEIKEYTDLEMIARTLIDNVVGGGFYFKTTWYETEGQGTDYMPVWEKTYSILKAYENTTLVWDASQTPSALGYWNYLLTKDKTAIIKDPIYYVSEYERQAQKPPYIPVAPSDSFTIFDGEDSPYTSTINVGVTFPQHWNYLFLLETGYKVVPYDVYEATRMLIDDLKCGKLDYYKRYVKHYSTDQFKIEYDKGLYGGTGNIVVDKILQKYVVSIAKPGVL